MPHRLYSAEEKALILETVRLAQERMGQPVRDILAQLGVPAATYYRWQARAAEGGLADEVVFPPIPGSPTRTGRGGSGGRRIKSARVLTKTFDLFSSSYSPITLTMTRFLLWPSNSA